VIPGVEHVVAKRLGLDGCVSDPVVGPVLGMKLYGDPDRLAWHAPILNLPLRRRSSSVSSMFRIGEFAALGGVSPRVLRNYDGSGLFEPAWVDPENGYRFYLASQLPDLRNILALRGLGVPLATIAELRDGGAQLAEVLRSERETLERRRRDTERRLAAMDITLADVHAGEPAVVVRRLEPTLVATLSKGTDVGAMFYALEKVVQAWGVRRPRPPISIRHPHGPEVAVPVRVPIEEGDVTSRRLRQTMAATFLHRGSYESMVGALERFERWVDASGYERTEPLQVVYLRFGAEDDLILDDRYLTDRTDELLTELVQPVR
jgi:DNA-binding transcriptional MerR regulator